MNHRQETETKLIVLLSIARQLMASREKKLFNQSLLTASQFGVLNHFSHNPKRSWTISELAHVMEMNQPGITKIVTVLLDKALLNSAEDKHDKRKKHLTITPQGLTTCQQVLSSLTPDIEHLFSSWEDQELSQFTSHIDKLTTWLDEHREDIKQG